MAYLAAMSAHSPQVLHFDKIQSRRMASRWSLSVVRTKSATMRARQAMRSEVGASEYCSDLTCGSGAGDGRAVAGMGENTPTGKSSGSQYPFGIERLPTRQECEVGVNCQPLVFKMSADASDLRTPETCAFCSGVPASGFVSRDSSSAWAMRSAAKTFTRSGGSPRSKAAKSWVLSKRSVGQLVMAGIYPVDQNARYAIPVAHESATISGAQNRHCPCHYVAGQPPKRVA